MVFFEKMSPVNVRSVILCVVLKHICFIPVTTSEAPQMSNVDSLAASDILGGVRGSNEHNLDRDWAKLGQDELNRILNRKQNTNIAKNVILFIGDGMGISTVTASRAYNRQYRNRTYEESHMPWEEFESTGLVWTHTTDLLTADSAGTANAILSGEKTRSIVVGHNQLVDMSDCVKGERNSNTIKSILSHSMESGKHTGFVTTTRATHATVAAAYAHTPNRDWENDFIIPQDCKPHVDDVAYQLIHSPDNKDIRVILGGGRREFMSKTEADPEYPEKTGKRNDSRNLIQDWLDMKHHDQLEDGEYKYVTNSSQFKETDPEKLKFLLGLFEPSHMNFEADRPNDRQGEPSLAEMTEKAIRILKKSKDGFFLLIEGGRIDHAHHRNNAYRAMVDTMAMADAVKVARDLTNEDDTLIVVTADHSHTLTISGYPSHEQDILGLSNLMGMDGKPFTTLGYANGQAHDAHIMADGSRKNLSETPTNDPNFQQDATVPLFAESHGGEDVGVYASGPMSHLFNGVHEQSYLAHVMMYASCVGGNKKHCDRTKGEEQPPTCGSVFVHSKSNCFYSMFVLMFVYFCCLFK